MMSSAIRIVLVAEVESLTSVDMSIFKVWREQVPLCSKHFPPHWIAETSERRDATGFSTVQLPLFFILHSYVSSSI